jgi:hypothetical protein
MAIYRAESTRRLALIAIVGLVVGLVGGFLLGRALAPDLAAQIDAVRVQAAPIHSTVEVLRIEYPKLLAQGEDPGGAEAAMARMVATLDEVQPTLATLNLAGTNALVDAVDDLGALIGARAPEAEVEAALAAVDAALGVVLGRAVPSGS